MALEPHRIDDNAVTLHATLTLLCLASNNWDTGKQRRPRQNASDQGVLSRSSMMP